MEKRSSCLKHIHGGCAVFPSFQPHISGTVVAQEVKPAHIQPRITNLAILSSIFPRREWKILICAALTSDIRQACDLCSECCASKQELRIRDEYYGSLFSVTSREAMFCQATRRSDMWRMAFYQQKRPVVTASAENQITRLLVPWKAITKKCLRREH